MSKHQVEQITTLVRQHYVDTWKPSHIAKYGRLNKGFNEYQLQQFFRVVENPKYRLLFMFQATLAFRIGEAVRLNISNINFTTRELKLRSEKSKRLDSLIVPVNLFKELVSFVSVNEKEINRAQGYIFFTDAGKSTRKEPFLEENYVRKVFRDYVKLAGIDEVYDNSVESNPNRKSRRLHLLTTHSLRHTAITTFSRKTNGNIVLAANFARHAQPSTTLRYIHSDKQELYDAIERLME